jgi:hypothetical protein
MGAHVNYYQIIEELILLKGEFHRIKNEKYRILINELNNYYVNRYADNDTIPNHKLLAVKLNLPQGKLNLLLKDLLRDLISEFMEPPLNIKNYIHQIHIHLPYDEERKLSKDRKEEARKASTWIEMVLPVTPRLGEEICIPLIQQTGKEYRGYVHRIQHTITGTTQEIYLEIHPFHDFYYKWEKMKDEYEYTKSWLASIRKQ